MKRPMVVLAVVEPSFSTLLGVYNTLLHRRSARPGFIMHKLRGFGDWCGVGVFPGYPVTFTSLSI